MKAIYGISRASAHQLKEFVGEFKDTFPPEKAKKLTCQFLGWGIEPQNKKIIFVPSITNLMNNREALEEIDAVVFVFDNPIVLTQANIPILDAINSGNYRWTYHNLTYDAFVAKLREGLNSKEGGKTVEKLTLDIVPRLLEQRQGVISHTLINLTYECRVPEKRRDITRAYARWLFSSDPIESLINELLDIGVDRQSIKRVEAVFESEKGIEARKVCAEITRMRTKAQRKKATGKPSTVSINYEKLCAGTSVEVFDLKYITQAVAKASQDMTAKSSRDATTERARLVNDKSEAERQQEINEQINAMMALPEDEGGDELDFSLLEQVNY